MQHVADHDALLVSERVVAVQVSPVEDLRVHRRRAETDVLVQRLSIRRIPCQLEEILSLSRARYLFLRQPLYQLLNSAHQVLVVAGELKCLASYALKLLSEVVLDDFTIAQIRYNSAHIELQVVHVRMAHALALDCHRLRVVGINALLLLVLWDEARPVVPRDNDDRVRVLLLQEVDDRAVGVVRVLQQRRV